MPMGRGYYFRVSQVKQKLALQYCQKVATERESQIDTCILYRSKPLSLSAITQLLLRSRIKHRVAEEKTHQINFLLPSCIVS
jgi:hypothetical protein